MNNLKIIIPIVVIAGIGFWLGWIAHPDIPKQPAKPSLSEELDQQSRQANQQCLDKGGVPIRHGGVLRLIDCKFPPVS